MPEDPEPAPVEAALGLGGNLGNRRRNLARALDRLAAQPGIRLLAVSALYETAPWGRTDQPPFLNAAVRIATILAPRALLDCCLAVERALGRERTERAERWGPRTIDIDILIYGDRAIAEPGLTVPHPALHERNFVLAPLLDVMPEARIKGRPAQDWLREAGQEGLTLLEPPGWLGPGPGPGGQASKSTGR